MKQMNLSEENVNNIIGALGIAEDETGSSYAEEKKILLKLFPKVKETRNKRAKEWDNEVKKQDEARKSITNFVFYQLEHNQPILPQLRNFVALKDSYDLVRNHYSDDICLSADLFKYHLKELKQIGLLKELREYLKIEGEKKENYWMRDDYKTTSDDDLWHDLARNLEKARGI